MLRAVLVTAACLAVCRSGSTAADDPHVVVLPMSAKADWATAPNGSGIVLVSDVGTSSEYLVGIITTAGSSTVRVNVAPDGRIVELSQGGDSGYSLAPPVALEQNGQVAYGFAVTSNGAAGPVASSAASSSWLDDYGNWFNETFGGGWSRVGGGVIHAVLTSVMEEETLADTGDATLLTGTVIVSVPVGVGVLYGGEVLLGVGTFGGEAAVTTTTTATLLGAEAEVAAAQAQLASLRGVLAQLQAIIANPASTPGQITLATTILAQIEAEIASLVAFIEFMSGI